MKLPDRWADWTCLDEIGQGSYGKVYELFKENEEGREEYAALKVIMVPEGYGESCLKEIQILSELADCENILDILDYHIESDKKVQMVYILMPLLENLSDYISLHPPDEREVIKMGIDLCRALERCEKDGILHRDIKPENIMVDRGCYILGDFGFATEIGNNLSKKGSYLYMAPEIFHGKPYSYTGDIYSLGLVMYKLMNRMREPFLPLDKKLVTYQDREEATEKRMNAFKLPAPVDAGPELSEIILRACARNPQKRYQSAGHFRKALERCLTGDYVSEADRKKKMMLICTFMVLCLLAVGYFRAERYSEVRQMISQWRDHSDLRYRMNRHGVLYIDHIKDLEDISSWDIPKNKIKKIVLGHGIESIGWGTFSECGNLERVSFPDTLKTIEKEAFAGCGKLMIHEENLPDHMDMIESDAFAGTRWEKEQTSNCLILRGFLIGYKGDEDHLKIPDAVRVIGSYFSIGNPNIQEVELSPNVTKVGDFALNDCSHLYDIQIPSSLTSFGISPFSGTPWADEEGEFLVVNGILLAHQERKEKVAVPSGVREIGNLVFSEDMKLREIIIPDTVKAISQDAFEGCRNLTEVVLPPHLEREDVFDCFRDTAWYENSIEEYISSH